MIALKRCIQGSNRESERYSCLGFSAVTTGYRGAQTTWPESQAGSEILSAEFVAKLLVLFVVR